LKTRVAHALVSDLLLEKMFTLPWRVDTLVMIQKLLSRKIAMTLDTFDAIISEFEKGLKDLADSPKFGTALFSFVKLYPEEVSSLLENIKLGI
jgi:hypothetical protein